MNDKVEQVKKALRKKRERRTVSKSDYLKTGGTLIDLACSGKSWGGFCKGHYYFVVGDSASGKTFLSMTCLAEASVNKEFNNYRLIYDDVEGGVLMDVERYFGPRLAERLEPPSRDEDNESMYSEFTEDFYANIDDAFKQGEPFIYVLDSMDCLDSKYAEQKFSEAVTAYRKDEKPKGDYGDNKAKLNSRNLRRVITRLRETGSILIIVNQTRDNVGAGLFESKKTRSGGHALTFYATVEIWSSVAGKVEKQVKGKKRRIGVISKVWVKKNRLTGRDRTVLVPIHYHYGIDDISSCVDYLVSEGVWKRNKQGVIWATGLGPEIKKQKEQLIQVIEEREAEDDLRELTAQTWQEVENACETKRKSRYG